MGEFKVLWRGIKKSKTLLLQERRKKVSVPGGPFFGCFLASILPSIATILPFYCSTWNLTQGKTLMILALSKNLTQQKKNKMKYVGWFNGSI